MKFRNPFNNKMSLAKFLGATAAALISGQISHEEVNATEKLVLDFYKLLRFQDFSFEALDIGSEKKQPPLPYAT